METSEPVSIESFSYSWLSNIRSPSLDGVNEPLRPSLGSSPATSFENSLEKSRNNFNFHIAISHSQASFVHADEIFSNGIIRPVFIDNPEHGIPPTLKTLPIKPPNSVVRRAIFRRVRSQLLWKWRKSSDQIFRKCFSYIKFPSCYNVEGCRSKPGSGSGADIGGDCMSQEIRSWNSSPRQSSPRISNSINHLSDNETSINEAVLHCKRSIENM